MLLKGLKISENNSESENNDNDNKIDGNFEKLQDIESSSCNSSSKKRKRKNSDELSCSSDPIANSLCDSDVYSDKKLKDKKKKSKKKKSKKYKKEKKNFTDILIMEKLKISKLNNEKREIRTLNLNLINDEDKIEKLLNKKREGSPNKPIVIEKTKDEIIFEKNKVILKANEEKKSKVDKLIDEIFDIFIQGDNKNFCVKFIELEKFSVLKENFFDKLINVKTITILKNNSDDESDDNERSFSYNNDVNNLRDYDLGDSTNLHAYDKNREFLNTEVNLKLKSDLISLNKFSKFEAGLNMDKGYIEVSNKINDNQNNEREKKLYKKDQQIIESLDKKVKKQEKIKLTVLSSCKKCYGAALNMDAVFSNSSRVYIAYPYTSGSITNHHMIISTKEHTNSFAAAEEDVYNEIRNYMKSIVSFNLERNLATVFVEFSQHVNNHNHMEIEAIPIKSRYLDDAKLYFKKAFMEQDSEWTTNKNIVDTVPHKGNLSKIINENFSYVHVDFNAQGGFLHIIEDITKFSQIFLKEIFCPLLKKESFEIKYPPKLSPKELFDVVVKYKHEFSYFDWTNY